LLGMLRERWCKEMGWVNSNSPARNQCKTV
jgi:hypothetical protein